MIILRYYFSIFILPTAMASTSTGEDELVPTYDTDSDSPSETNSNSSINDFEISSGSDSDLHMELGHDHVEHAVDFTVPDIKANPPQWTENVQSFVVPPFRFKGGPTLPETFSNTSLPLDYLKLFVTDSLIENIVKFTNEYAHIQIAKKRIRNTQYRDKEWASDGSDNVTVEEMWAYLGCCIIMSINPSRQLRHIFSSDPYMNNPGIRNVFTLKRFTKISNFFCVSDKSIEPARDSKNYDKLFKMRPVVEHLNNLFPRYWHYSATVCIDESTIRMRSRDSVKQFNPSKPNRYGWKVWSCCDSDSPQKPYLISFIPYLGKKFTKVSKHGLFFDVVTKLTEPMRGSNVRLYTDSAYSHLRTFSYLMKHSIFATGTVRKNTVGLHPSVRVPPKKMARGAYKIFQCQNNRNITCCLWNDTRGVRFISTEADPTKVGGALRRVGGKYERIAQPAVAGKYGQFYKSIDQFDFLSTKYTIARRSYRPWKYLWSFCLQASIVNAYILYISTSTVQRKRTYSQVEFRLALAKQMIGDFSVRKYQPKIEPLFIAPEGPSERFVNHQNTRMPGSRGKVCKKHKTFFGKSNRTVFGCLACNIHLCKYCHVKWHTSNNQQ